MLLTKLGNLKSLVLGQYFPRLTVTRGGGRYPRDRGQSATSPWPPTPTTTTTQTSARPSLGPPAAPLVAWIPPLQRVTAAFSARGSTDLFLISIFLLLTASMLRWRTCLPSAEAEVIWGEASQGNAFPEVPELEVQSTFGKIHYILSMLSVNIRWIQHLLWIE